MPRLMGNLETKHLQIENRNQNIERVPGSVRYVDTVECEMCHSSEKRCPACFGWGGVFLDPETKEPVDATTQENIVTYWQNNNVEPHGTKFLNLMGMCSCGYEKIMTSIHNAPKDFYNAEKEIYMGHDNETDCPHEPGITAQESI